MMQNAASLFMLALLFSLLCIGLSSSVPPEKQTFQGRRALEIQSQGANFTRAQTTVGEYNRKLEQSLAAVQAKISDLEDRVRVLQQRIDRNLANSNPPDGPNIELSAADKVRVNYRLSSESRGLRARGSVIKSHRSGQQDLFGQESISGMSDLMWDNESASLVSDKFDFPEFGDRAMNDLGCRSAICRVTILDDGTDAFTRFQLMFPLESADFLAQTSLGRGSNPDGFSQSVVYPAKPGY